MAGCKLDREGFLYVKPAPDQHIPPQSPLNLCRGPRALAWLVVAALGAIMTLGIVDLVEEIEASRGGAPPPLAAAAAMRRLLGA